MEKTHRSSGTTAAANASSFNSDANVGALSGDGGKTRSNGIQNSLKSLNRVSYKISKPLPRNPVADPTPVAARAAPAPKQPETAAGGGGGPPYPAAAAAGVQHRQERLPRRRPEAHWIPRAPREPPAARGGPSSSLFSRASLPSPPHPSAAARPAFPAADSPGSGSGLAAACHGRLDSAAPLPSAASPGRQRRGGVADLRLHASPPQRRCPIRPGPVSHVGPDRAAGYGMPSVTADGVSDDDGGPGDAVPGLPRGTAGEPQIGKIPDARGFRRHRQR
ncbi:hypothetical protein BHE74_00008926 [Ensete ventricosum]|nr:hypothetical protein BHE74_00008926 [Ensete ventricosum]